MITLRRLVTNSTIRIPFYVQKPFKVKSREKMSTKQVHKEVMKYINQYAKIKIKSDIYLKVHAADVHRHPNADVLIAELHGAHAKNCNIDLLINVSDDEKEIDVKISRVQNAGQDFHCELAVPVKASLCIEGKHGVNIEHMLGDEVNIAAEGSVKTRDVRCEKITIKSGNGNINCAGTLLGKKTYLETRQKGCVLLDKLQGDELVCKTEAGDIHTNCCYVESSTFETDSGCLELKNVHKEAKILVHNPEGALHMSGVHGNLQVKMNGSVMKLQLSELQGESVIFADNIETANINISNEIEQRTEMDVSAQSINLNPTLTYFATHLTNQNQKLHYKPTSREVIRTSHSKLTVRCPNGNVILGKQSWAEMMCGNFKSSNNITF